MFILGSFTFVCQFFLISFFLILLSMFVCCFSVYLLCDSFILFWNFLFQNLKSKHFHWFNAIYKTILKCLLYMKNTQNSYWKSLLFSFFHLLYVLTHSKHFNSQVQRSRRRSKMGGWVNSTFRGRGRGEGRGFYWRICVWMLSLPCEIQMFENIRDYLT